MENHKSKVGQKSCIFREISAAYVSSLDKLLVSLDEKDNYGIEIAFSVTHINKEIAIMMSFWINRKSQVPGYVIHTETFNYFEAPGFFDPQQPLEESDYYELTCLELSIDTVREAIREITRHFPIGAYEVPEIDIEELYRSKTFHRNNKTRWN